MQRRILVVNHEFPPLEGGGANASFFISRALVRMGWAVDVVTADLGRLAREEHVEGMAVHRARGRKRALGPARLFDLGEFVVSGTREAIRRVDEARPDALIAFFTLPAGLVGLRVRGRRGIPLIVSLRGTDVPGNNPETFRLAHRLTAPLTRRVLRRADRVTAVSEELRDVALRSDPALRIDVVHNGVDAERFRPPAGRSPGESIRILSVGQTIARKGHETLIRALPDVIRRTGKDVRVVIVGRKGPDHDALVRLSHELGLAGRVTFAGAASRSEMPAAYGESDLLAHLSVCEGMSNVVLEAMASGLPVIATKVGGMPALVEEGVNGFLVQVGSSAATADALVALVEDSTRRTLFGKQSRDRAETLSWEACARRYATLVIELAGDAFAERGSRDSMVSS